MGSLRESVEEKVEVRATGIAQRGPKRTALWAALVLVALNVAGGVYLLGNRASLSPDVREAFTDVQVVSRAVEENRDEKRRVPATLEGLRPPLPPILEARVRRGEIRYQASEDRSTFEVEVSLEAPAVPPSTAAVPAPPASPR
jgi:hypothetical protein